MTATDNAPNTKFVDWSAWQGFDTEDLLEVRGLYQVGSTAVSCELRRHEPQGSNPADLLLDLIVDEGEVGAAVLNYKRLEYTEKGDTSYEQITIVTHGHSVPVRHPLDVAAAALNDG